MKITKKTAAAVKTKPRSTAKPKAAVTTTAAAPTVLTHADAATIQAVAERMRQSYGEWLGEEVVPWPDSDKQEVWLKIAEDGITTYEQIVFPQQ